MTFAQSIYLKLLLAEDYKDQNPEYVNARWYHLLWFLVPIIGMVLFIESVKVEDDNSDST